MLHFAYGSNMSVSMMRARCPGAHAVGIAVLAGWRFLINADGYATLAPHRGSAVHGVLWRVSAREVAVLDAYEAVAAGLYRRRVLTVIHDSRPSPALVYVARRRHPGWPRPGYLEPVVEAARQWRFPPRYVGNIGRFAGSRLRAARARDVGDLR